MFCLKGKRQRVLLATAVHRRAANSSCKHADLCSDSASAFQTFYLSPAKIESYNGDSAPKESLSVVFHFLLFYNVLNCFL